MAIKRLETAARNSKFLEVIASEVQSLDGTWALWGMKYGDRPERLKGLRTLLQEIEARSFTRGKPKPAVSPPYDYQFIIYEWLLPKLQREKADVRESEECIRRMLDEMGEKGRKTGITGDLLRNVSGISASDEALILLAHVFGGSASTLRREFVLSRQRKPKLLALPRKRKASPRSR